MRQIDLQSRFKRDYKREKKANPSLDAILTPVLNMLATDSALPANLSDHPLKGEWRGFRDCHIKPDLVLIYSKSEGVLSLARLGSHSELFR
jgi:mRNA interferase YafQ